MSQILDCFKIVKIYKKESFFFNKIKIHSKKWSEASVSSFLYAQMFSMFGNYISSIAPLVVLGYGAMLIMQGGLSVEKMMAFYLIMNDLYIPVDELFRFLTNQNSIRPVFERNADLLMHQPNEEKKIGKVENVEILELDNVNYSFDKQKIINNFSKRFAKGKIYCLTGPNGAGKSTLMNIISGIYPVNHTNYVPSEQLDAPIKWLEFFQELLMKTFGLKMKINFKNLLMTI